MNASASETIFFLRYTTSTTGDSHFSISLIKQPSALKHEKIVGTVTESQGFEGTSRDQVQSPSLLKQVPLQHVKQVGIHTGLDCLQRRRLQNFCGKTIQT